MTTNTCADFIRLILKRGGRLRIQQIGYSILCDYGVQFQDDTISECLSSLTREGKVLSAPVNAGKGKTSFEYWWVLPAKKKEAFPLSTGQLRKRCLEIAATYPDEHPEMTKIMNQIASLEAMERKVA